MRAAVMDAFHEPLTVREVADPVCDAEGAIVRVEACGICRSDWHTWIGHWPGVIEFPAVLGHELSGVVEEVGGQVKRVRPGDRVIVPFCGGCGACEWCLGGDQHVCDDPYQPGFDFWGGFARLVYVRHADLNTVALPGEVDFVTASGMGCRYMTAFHALADVARVGPGEWLAVHGCGGVGLSAVQIGAALGARVIAVDIDSEKLDLATALGAEAVINGSNVDAARAVRELTAGGAQASIDALGIAATCGNSVRSLRKLGRHVQIGITSPDEKGKIALPMDRIMAMELQVLGSHGMPVNGYRRLLGLVQAGRLDPGRLVTRRVPLEETGAVLASMEGFATQGFTVIDRY